MVSNNPHQSGFLSLFHGAQIFMEMPEGLPEEGRQGQGMGLCQQSSSAYIYLCNEVLRKMPFPKGGLLIKNFFENNQNLNSPTRLLHFFLFKKMFKSI